ncbi:uncharacterized protein LOC111114900 isoform X2 [Crassostrea virginica]
MTKYVYIYLQKTQTTKQTRTAVVYGSVESGGTMALLFSNNGIYCISFVYEEQWVLEFSRDDSGFRISWMFWTVPVYSNKLNIQIHEGDKSRT